MRCLCETYCQHHLCRPDFEATLAALEQAHPGTHIGVFYCGGFFLWVLLTIQAVVLPQQTCIAG
jgi:hypothetical protein